MNRFLLAAALCLAATPGLAQNDKNAPGPANAEKKESAEQLAALAQKLSPSLVRVEFIARYDKGESPGDGRMGAMRRFLPPALRAAMGDGWESWDDLMSEERPGERGGVLISPTRVVVADPILHPRFIKSVAVRFGDRVVEASPGGYPKGRRYMILELARPLEGALPVSFKADAPAPYYAVMHGRDGGVWSTAVSALSTEVTVASDGRSGSGCPGEALIVDKSGAAVAMTGVDLLTLDGSWKGTPESWPSVSQKEMSSLLEKLAGRTDHSVLRVALSLRSPRGQSEPMGRFGGLGRDEESSAITEWNGSGLLVDPTTVLVLAGLKPKVTGRLERITVHLPDGTQRQASFAGSLKDWGGFLAKLDSALEGQARLSTAPVLDQRDRLLLQAMVTVRGEAREAYYWRNRITDFGLGFGGQVFPTENSLSSSWNPWGQTAPATRALFALDGTLVALQMNRRPKVTTEEGPESSILVPAGLLGDLLKDRSKHLDQENRPLGEDEENRLAWLGAELQGMNPELARANNVADQTEGGRTGGLVTYVYPESPAAVAGVKEGDILLRLHVEGQPKPLDVGAGGSDAGGMMENFWQYLDQMPEEYFDQMPKPWGSAETPLTRALTDVGIGTPFSADIFRDGKVVTADFKVAQGPAHYDAANRFKSEELGVTVRDLTYEVRRYFRIKPGDAGVIISKIEKGGRASVAGLKPYEIITSIDDKPVAAAEGAQRIIEEALKSGTELRLAVKRMTKGRIVKIKLDAPAAEPSGRSDGT